MVLFKRKTVTIPSPKYVPEHADQEVWFIPETLEYFCHYDDYLARMDFYMKKKFICELSGASCLTYFEARRRENLETENVLKRFPEPLKQPILSRVHMSTTTRLDQLVDELYSWLKDRYFVGEFVTVRFEDQKVRAEVTKATDGVYQVDDGRRILEGDASQLVRDRKVVSKLTLRAFVKHAASREQWLGAPWIVREDYVKTYNLPSEIPPEVQRLYKQRLEETEKAQYGGDQSASAKLPSFIDDESIEEADEEAVAVPQAAGRSSSQRLSRKRIIKTLETLPDMRHISSDDLFALARLAADEPFSEYVELRLKFNPWPEWHTDSRLDELQAAGKVGHLFEIWLFSQLFRDFLGLTENELLSFDAFVDALGSHDVPRPIAALHEAVLNCFVPEGEPKFAIPLPSQANLDPPKRKKKGRRPTKRPKQESNDELAEMEEGEDENEKEEGDNGAAGAADAADTADGGDGGEDDDDDDSAYDSNESDDENVKGHGSDKENDTWVEKIARRQYEDGGWQQIVSEILADLSYLRDWHAETRSVVELLSPPQSQAHTTTFAASAYAELPLVHKVHALTMLVRTLYGSAAFREHLDSQYDALNKLRKQPLSRELKQLKDDLKTLERVVRLMKEGDQTAELDVKAEDGEGTSHKKEDDKGGEKSKKTANAEAKAEDSEEAPSLETLERNIVLLKEQIESKSAEVLKVMKLIARLDGQRMRMLGEDRFFNRYWWLDGNGVADALSDEHYAMGRLCVQGPTPENLEQCLNSQAYARDFVEYRKIVLQQAHKLKQQHKLQLKLRREARSEYERNTSHTPTKAMTPNLGDSVNIAPKPSPSQTPKKSSVAAVEKRLTELLEIHKSSRGLNEQELREMQILQSEAAKSGVSESSTSKPTNQNELAPQVGAESNGGLQSTPSSDVAGTKDSAGTNGDGQQQGEQEQLPQQSQLTDQQLRLKQAQDQIQMRAQIAARIQAHFDAEVQAQANARTQQPQVADAPRVTPQQFQSYLPQQPPVVPQGVFPQPQQQPNQPFQMYPLQDQVQWVVQQTAYGPMLYAVPVQQYQLLMQHYGLHGGMPTNPPAATDAYQAYLQQVAMQQLYHPQAASYPQGYPQPVAGSQPPAVPVGGLAMQPAVPQPVQANPIPQPVVPSPVAPEAPQGSQDAQVKSDANTSKSSYLAQVMNSSLPHTVGDEPRGVVEGKTDSNADTKPSTVLTGSDQHNAVKSEVPVSTNPAHDVNHTSQGEQPTIKVENSDNESARNGQSQDHEKADAGTTRSSQRVQERPLNDKSAEHDHASENMAQQKLSTEKPNELGDVSVQEAPLTPLELLDMFENKHSILSSNEWRFYETPDEFDQLIGYLLESGSRESKLLDALRKSEKDIKRSMVLRLESLGLKDNAEAPKTPNGN